MAWEEVLFIKKKKNLFPALDLVQVHSLWYKVAYQNTEDYFLAYIKDGLFLTSFQKIVCLIYSTTILGSYTPAHFRLII